MYSVALVIYALEWMLLVLLWGTYVLLPIAANGFSITGLHIDPLWPRVLPIAIVLLGIPLALAIRRTRVNRFTLPKEFLLQSTTSMFLTSLLIFLGLFAVVCLLLLSILPLGVSVLSAPLWVLGGVFIACSLGAGSLAMEFLYIRWQTKLLSNNSLKSDAAKPRTLG